MTANLSPSSGVTTTPGGTPVEKSRARRAAASAMIGGALEYYDFYIYALAAAIVFPTVMFPSDGGTFTNVLLSLGTLGVGYVARPVGAIVFGHFGDKFGRKRILLLTILLMGIATFVIGFLPNFEQIGYAAPIILVAMRLAQGFSAGAETTGASTITLESAPHGRRAFYTSFTQCGNLSGFVLANLAFLPVAALPPEILFTWGWRIPFFASALVVIVALMIRRRLEEPEIFVEEVSEAHAEVKIPLIDALRRYPGGIFKMFLITTSASASTMLFTFGLAFATRPEFGIEIPYTTMIWACIAGNAVGVVLQPFWGLLSDRIGRRPLIISGALGSAVASFGYFWAIANSNIPLIFASIIVSFSILYTMLNAVFQTFGGEMFDVKVRYTATSLGFQAGIVVVGFLPAIATGLVSGGNWLAAPLIILVTCVLAAVAAFVSKETSATPLAQLGR